MNDAELEAERIHLIETRLGILCGTDDPTPEQLDLARKEANEAVERLKELP